MVDTIIASNPTYQKEAKQDGSYALNIAENFYNTVQGEGVTAGVPSMFLRMQGCTLRCVWCDTTETWRYGNPYSVNEVVDMWKEQGALDKLYNGQHLVLTGGSPLRQQKGLVKLLSKIKTPYLNEIYVEVENEGILVPDDEFVKYVNQWNNSPKLSNSGLAKPVRYRPNTLQYMNSLHNSWFKFVISDTEKDWAEIKLDYLDKKLIDKDKIILMPEGSTREELRSKYDEVVNLATKEGVRFSDRLQVTLWDKTVGV